eukprot:Sro2957_g340981.2  (91) ;mRNA; f:5888-6160
MAGDFNPSPFTQYFASGFTVTPSRKPPPMGRTLGRATILIKQASVAKSRQASSLLEVVLQTPQYKLVVYPNLVDRGYLYLFSSYIHGEFN